MKKISSGKVREIYEANEDSLMMVVSDRISAFDVILPTMVKDKGKVLNKISEFWFDFVSDVIPNHIITTKFEEFPEEFKKEEFRNRSMLVRKLKMLPIECIVRGYLTGSGWKSYQECGSVCGIELPKGLRESEKLPEPIFTPTTKAQEGHDMNISFDEVCDLIGKDLAEKVKNKTIEIYKKCAEYAKSKGIIIADTKFEFGLDENGNLVLADEVLTPDSSRFWPADEYEVGRSQKSFDKQYMRDWLKTNNWDAENPTPIPEDVVETTRAKYIEAYERLTGKKFDM